MFKKISGIILGFIALCFIFNKLNAATSFIFPQKWDAIQISSTASPANLLQGLQIPLQPSNQSNVGMKACLTGLAWSGDNFPSAGTTLSVLDNATTAYTVTVTTFTSGIYYMSWGENFPLCLNFNTTGYIQVSTGNYKVNAYGYRRDF